MAASGRLFTSADIADGTITNADIAPGQLPALIASSGVMGAPIAYLDFTTIPQVYTSLEVRILGRSTAVLTTETVRMTVNGLGSGYYNQRVYGSGATAGGAEALAATTAELGYIPAASASAAGWMGQITVVLHGYRAGSLYRSLMAASYGGWNTTTGSQLAQQLGSTATGTTAAVTSLRLFPATGSWAAGSVISLYGYP